MLPSAQLDRILLRLRQSQLVSQSLEAELLSLVENADHEISDSAGTEAKAARATMAIADCLFPQPQGSAMSRLAEAVAMFVDVGKLGDVTPEERDQITASAAAYLRRAPLADARSATESALLSDVAVSLRSEGNDSELVDELGDIAVSEALRAAVLDVGLADSLVDASVLSTPWLWRRSIRSESRQAARCAELVQALRDRVSSDCLPFVLYAEAFVESALAVGAAMITARTAVAEHARGAIVALTDLRANCPEAVSGMQDSHHTGSFTSIWLSTKDVESVLIQTGSACIAVGEVDLAMTTVDTLSNWENVSEMSRVLKSVVSQRGL
jgi:hypothetical protein